MILSTVPGMLELAGSGIRVVSSFSSAIFADLAMRGFPISFLTRACVLSLDSFLLFCAASTHHAIEMARPQSPIAQFENRPPITRPLDRKWRHPHPMLFTIGQTLP
jgi:hypothetical protein